jgi:hypothetical protein
MRHSLTLALALVGTSAWGQTPQAPNPSPPKSTPQAQPPPPVQLYRLVPVEQPQQTVQVQQPQYQTVQLVQQPAPCQTVQQVQYVPATQTTFGLTLAGGRTVVLGPSIAGLSIARIGEMVSNTFGKTHVWKIQHSIIRPQPQPAPPVEQLVTVSMPQPVVQQPVQVQLLQQPVQQVLQPQYQINAPSEAAPPPPVVPVGPPKPSPQASSIPAPKHHLFGMLGN